MTNPTPVGQEFLSPAVPAAAPVQRESGGDAVLVGVGPVCVDCRNEAASCFCPCPLCGKRTDTAPRDEASCQCSYEDLALALRNGRTVIGCWTKADIVDLRDRLTTAHISAFIAGERVSADAAMDARQFIYRVLTEAHQFCDEALSDVSPKGGGPA